MTNEYAMLIKRTELQDGVWYVAMIPSLSIAAQARTALEALAQLEIHFLGRQQITKDLDTTIFNYLPEDEDKAATDFWFETV